MKEQISKYLHKLLADLVQNDTQVILFIVLIICTVIVLDAIYTYTRIKRRSVGIASSKETLADVIKNRKIIEGQHYLSEIQSLAGRPDAIILENNFIIPVERKPFARKLRDRYIAQLLVYMRLIEEFEGLRPPYGYLVLGKNCRRIKIANTPERQAWLQTFIDEMQAILNKQAQALPSPHPQKCNKCNVKNSCSAAFVPHIKIRNPSFPVAKVS